MTDTGELQRLIRASGLKKTYIASKLGLTPMSLLRKEKNEQEFKPSEIVMLCSLLGITSLTEKERIFFAKEVERNSTVKEARDV